MRGLGKTLLFDIAHGLAQRVLLTKWVKLDGDIHPYLATLMVAAPAWMGETLVVLDGTWITIMIREAFDNMLLKEVGHNYDYYMLVSQYDWDWGWKGCLKRLSWCTISALSPG